MTARLLLLTLAAWVSAANPAWAERLVVTTPIANIRTGPGTGYPVVWQVEQYHPLKIIERQGPWCRFEDFEGDHGWIHKSLLGKIDAVITVKEACNVRSGPGMNFEVVFMVGAGVPFKVRKRQDAWLHVEHADGDQGWIERSLVW